MAKKRGGEILCFAYGSNMLSSRMRHPERVPSAVPRGVGFVPGHRLTFDKVSIDGSGKCDAEATGHDGDRVHGVLYAVKKSEKPQLDRAEGLGNGYDEKAVDVVTGRGKKRAVLYYATSKNPSLKPYHWYKAYVVAGAMEHGLPFPYVEWLRTAESQQHSDIARRLAEERALSNFPIPNSAAAGKRTPRRRKSRANQ